MTPLKRKSTRWIIAILLAAAFSFVFGIGVGLYHWPPFLTLKHLQDGAVDSWRRRTLTNDQTLLEIAFTDPMIDGEQIHPPITTPAGLREAQLSMLLPVDRFYGAYDSLEVVRSGERTLGDARVLEVGYRLAGREYGGYAYIRNAAGRMAVLVIPGTGLNQSSAIYRDDHSNYQADIVEAFGPDTAVFIFIKPNEDCLALHSGGRKLNQGFFLNWLLNAGGSYSAHYIANSLAVTKYLQSNYEQVAVVGLSQGGYATLLNALQSQPDFAVVASGYGVGAQDMPSRHDQIIIPGLRRRLTDEAIRARMREMKTRFLFTYGSKEVGEYGIEATEHRTCEYLSELQNVDCLTHGDGHEFPLNAVRTFLSAAQ